MEEKKEEREEDRKDFNDDLSYCSLVSLPFPNPVVFLSASVSFICKVS